MSGEKPVFQALPPSNEIALDGCVLRAHDIVQGDSSANSFPHVPGIDLVVAGDLVYDDCFQNLAEANTKEKRANWIEAVEQIDGLKPQILVPGHKLVSQIDGAYLTASKKRYVRIFEKELEQAENADTLETRMKELFPERWNDYILQVSCQACFAKVTPKQQRLRRGCVHFSFVAGMTSRELSSEARVSCECLQLSIGLKLEYLLSGHKQQTATSDLRDKHQTNPLLVPKSVLSA